MARTVRKLTQLPKNTTSNKSTWSGIINGPTTNNI